MGNCIYHITGKESRDGIVSYDISKIIQRAEEITGLKLIQLERFNSKAMFTKLKNKKRKLRGKPPAELDRRFQRLDTNYWKVFLLKGTFLIVTSLILGDDMLHCFVLNLEPDGRSYLYESGEECWEIRNELVADKDYVLSVCANAKIAKILFVICFAEKVDNGFEGKISDLYNGI